MKDKEKDGLNPSQRPTTEQRAAERVKVDIQVDCHNEGNFLFASIRNLSEMGIFVETRTPVPTGTELTLEFVLPVSGAKILATGVVVWTNAYREGEENLNPGMGIRFTNLSESDRQKICDLIRKIAYVEMEEEPKN